MKVKLGFVALVLLLAGLAYAPDTASSPSSFRIDHAYPTGRVNFAISALDPDVVLSGTASTIAGREVFVVCVRKGEPGDQTMAGAWGYVYLTGDNEYMSEEVCDGLHALSSVNENDRSATPNWKQALGALVLTHESFHLNQAVKDPGSEARTECRAIKNFARTVRLLQDDVRVAQTLLPYALAIHWRIAAKVKAYYWEPCSVPNFWPSDES